MSAYDVVIAFLIGSVSLLAAIGFVLALRDLYRRATSPQLHQIIAALEIWALRGVYGAENMVLNAEEDVRKQLDGYDKKAFADGVYDRLPDAIIVAGRVLPVGVVKMFVTREAFEELVQRVFGEADGFIKENEDYLKKQVGTLKPIV